MMGGRTAAEYVMRWRIVNDVEAHSRRLKVEARPAINTLA